MTRRRRVMLYVAIGAFAVVTVYALVMNVTVCRDWAYICENTGSRKGHRQWRTGPKANEWYRRSALERVMKENCPGDLTHRWTNYATTGKTLCGKAVSYEHERPGPVTQLGLVEIDQWVKQHSPEEARQLHNTLASGDPAAIQATVDAVLAEVAPRGK